MRQDMQASKQAGWVPGRLGGTSPRAAHGRQLRAGRGREGGWSERQAGRA